MIPIAKPLIGLEELTNISAVLQSGVLAQGEWVSKFENGFSGLFSYKHSAAIVNGTCALDLIVRALGMKEGDEVIVPDFTFIATANSVAYSGAKPVFADVLPDTFNIDPTDVARKITAKTKAVMAVHLYGQSADMKDLKEICDDKKIPLIEDACQAHGAKYDGKYVGSIGTAGAFSFYPTKNMTSGEGGMVTTSDPEFDKKIRVLRDQGQSKKYIHTELGFNFRMTNVNAAIGLAQLVKLPAFNAARQKNASILTKALGGITGLKTPFVDPKCEHVYHQYVLTLEKEYPLSRDEFMQKLNAAGIGSAVHYPIPLHQQPYYQSKGYPKDICPVSRDLANRVVSIPVHPALSREDLDHIVSTIRSFSG